MVKKAGTWSEEAMFWIMKFEPANQKELLMQTCAVLNVVTTQRPETLQQYLCVDVTVEPATAEFPRCLQFKSRFHKTNIMGTDEENLGVVVVACTCIDTLARKAQQDFALACKGNPNTPCVKPCPFNIVMRYRNTIPDFDDSLKQNADSTAQRNNPLGEITKPLHFLRALTAT